MEAIAIILLVATLIGLGFLLIFYWAWKSGQFDNIEGPAHRMLHDEDETQNK